MPTMDGLELAEILHREYPDIEVLILSAYSDFAYAKQALQCGVNDYIIKNDFLSELPRAIENTKNTLRIREQKRLNEMVNKKRMKTYLLEALVFDKLLPVEGEIGSLNLDNKQYCVCCCEFSYEEGEKSRPNILKAMENFFGMASEPFEHYLLNTSIDNMTILFCKEKQKIFEVKEIFILFSEILHIAEEFLRISIKVGISHIVQAENLHQGYEQARNALFHSTESGNEILLFNEKEAEYGWSDSFMKLKKEVVKRLFEKDYTEAEKKLGEMKKKLRDTGLPLDAVQANVVNFCSTVFRNLDERFEVKDILEIETEIYNQVYSKKTLYHLLKICDESFEKVKQVMETSCMDKHYLVNAIDEYIEKNCCKNLTLQQISEEVHASTSYISRLYKKKTGLTLTAAINRLRIQKAKALLSETTYRIYEIAEMVGVEDAGYFTTLFIKYEGCSPSEYRGMSETNDDQHSRKTKYLKKEQKNTSISPGKDSGRKLVFFEQNIQAKGK